MNTSNNCGEQLSDQTKHLKDGEAQAPHGRDGRGRFAKGNKFGPGNPFARKVAALRTALIETVTEEDMRSIAQQLVVIARLGDMAAIKLLFQYVLGKPATAVDPDTLDLQELDLYRRGPSPKDVQEMACERLPAEAVAEVLRIEMPCLGASFKEDAARGALGIGPDDDLEEEDEEAAAGQRQEDAAPSPNREVADDSRQTMTGPSVNGGPGRRAEAEALLEELLRRAEAARRGGNSGAPPSGNGDHGGQPALDGLRRPRRG
jgi:hypothetical protein